MLLFVVQKTYAKAFFFRWGLIRTDSFRQYHLEKLFEILACKSADLKKLVVFLLGKWAAGRKFLLALLKAYSIVDLVGQQKDFSSGTLQQSNPELQFKITGEVGEGVHKQNDVGFMEV